MFASPDIYFRVRPLHTRLYNGWGRWCLRDLFSSRRETRRLETCQTFPVRLSSHRARVSHCNNKNMPHEMIRAFGHLYCKAILGWKQPGLIRFYKWCFRLWLYNVRLYWASEIFGLNHAPGAKSIAVDLQSSMLPLCYGCPLTFMRVHTISTGYMDNSNLHTRIISWKTWQTR